MSNLFLNSTNLVTFVMVDAGGTEVTGLGSGFTLQVSKNGGAFGASAGAKAEIGNGWYSYQLTATECNTIGPISIRVTGAGCVQQNLYYKVYFKAYPLIAPILNRTSTSWGFATSYFSAAAVSDYVGSVMIMVSGNSAGVSRVITEDAVGGGPSYVFSFTDATNNLPAVGDYVAFVPQTLTTEDIPGTSALLDTTIASVSSQTVFTLAAGSNVNDVYKRLIIVLYDVSNSNYPSIRTVANYVGATKTVTLNAAPDFTIVNGDGARIYVSVPSGVLSGGLIML